MNANRFGPFVVGELIGYNYVKVELPNHFKIHPVVRVRHTMPFADQASDIVQPIETKPVPVPNVCGEEQEVGLILRHLLRSRQFQFLTMIKVEPLHDAEWQPN